MWLGFAAFSLTRGYASVCCQETREPDGYITIFIEDFEATLTRRNVHIVLIIWVFSSGILVTLGFETEDSVFFPRCFPEISASKVSCE